MTFEAALGAALVILGLSDVPVDRMHARWAPHTLTGESAAAWSYERDVIAVGVNIEWDEQADDWTRRFVAAHEACHIKHHMKWIKAAAHTISVHQMVLNELSADHCAIVVMAIEADVAPSCPEK